ncbi:MAG: 3-dehydroquinate synthase [Bacteroidales bacterium]|nr:3-dehydroquinate synthase [Bacteroidales bacterium]MBR6160546.1 3-dehydroquinate synthase [Bacteroidales bacterium]
MEKKEDSNHIQHLIDYLWNRSAHQVVVLADANVQALYPHYLSPLAASFDCHTMVVPAGEASKTLDQAEKIWRELLDRQYGKDVVMVNFGGGMICDLGGFVAATYKRGVRCVNVPTTLLAMIDAAYGGKTGVDVDHVKNCVGVIRQPDLVVPADVAFLQTLPVEELKSGFGELVKYAVLFSENLFTELESMPALTAAQIRPEWIAKCVYFKESVVALDPEDRNERRVLNFGHTYGHAWESYCAALGRPVPHGVAVAIGMLYESRRLAQLGTMPQEDAQRIERLVRRHFNVPEWDETVMKQLNPYLFQDKKNEADKVVFVEIHRIGGLFYKEV